jgi:hypothetical protein
MRDKSNQDPSGDLDGDRSFYENLPFHGIAPPPNKVSFIIVFTIITLFP